MMVYVWSKRNPFIHMSFLGLFTFTAAYLPWLSGKFNLEGNIELQVGVSSSAPGSGYSLLVAQMEPKIIRTELLELLFMKVMGEGEEHRVVKIADFGLARIYHAPLKPLSENGLQ
ncbi:derlin-2.2-like isoform X1 [Gastrolobium bilobum]|uniref:derlin-2.2-like isoform X1 n=1 Tax=Gastrolobium bilobum TaxID=150636 RepID=UPI002AB26267|nr:derlin-2.2-like isoform X1 [Gastrolobium bilobum]